MRDRVMAVIEKSGFRPNANARRLVRGSSGHVCFLLSNRDLSDSFHSRILKGVEDYSRQQHHHVVYTGFDYGADTALPNADLPRILGEDGGTEGVVLAGTNYPVLVRYIESLSIPYVLFGNNLVRESDAYPKQNSVGFDEGKGAREATEFLLELGHREVAFVGDLSALWNRRRCQGYQAAMEAKNLRSLLVDLRGEPDAFELGCRAVPELIRRCSSATAVLAQDDETACGLVVTLRRLGIAVPNRPQRRRFRRHSVRAISYASTNNRPRPQGARRLDHGGAVVSENSRQTVSGRAARHRAGHSRIVRARSGRTEGTRRERIGLMENRLNSKEELALAGEPRRSAVRFGAGWRHGEEEKRLLNEVIDSDVLFFFTGTKVAELQAHLRLDVRDAPRRRMLQRHGCNAHRRGRPRAAGRFGGDRPRRLRIWAPSPEFCTRA